MISGSLLSALGIAVSVIFGIIGIYLTVRSRYTGRITFVEEQTIELFDAIGNSLDGLSVAYEDVPITENLVLLNGAFINSGRTDLSPEMVEQPVTVTLPEEYQWLTGQVVESNCQANLILLNNQSFEIRTGLFRRNEHIKFHALAKLPDQDGELTSSRALVKNLNFSHRITNTTKIDSTDVDIRKTSFKYYKRRLIPLLIMLLVSLGLATYILYSGLPKRMAFPYQIDSETVEYVDVRIQSDDLVVVKSHESDFEDEVSFEVLVSNIMGEPVLEDSDEWRSFAIILFAQFLMFFAMIGVMGYEYNRNRRLIKVLEST